jgi:hypothetical protein
LPLREQERFAAVLEQIRLSASRQREILELVQELAVMRGIRLADLFNRAAARNILEDPGLSPFQKGEKLRDTFHRLRNPRLSRAMERFQAEKNKLGLPGSIRIMPEPFFETSRVRVEFEATNADRLRRMIAALHDAAQKSTLANLFQV